MTSPVEVTAPGATPRRRGLHRLVAGDPDAFAAQVWGRQALLSRAADLPLPFDDLLGPDAVDELVSRRGLRTPFLRVARAGSTLPERAFTAPGGTGAGVSDQVSDDRLVGLFADGATMVLQGLHRTWSPLVDLAQDVAADLGHPVQVNAYVTPPQSRGFDDHYDVHDVFVAQVEGRKRWVVRAPVHELPLRDQPWTDRRQAVRDAVAAGDPLLDVVLEPGDCLYLPRGFLHAATALGDVSTHLTIGVHTWTRHRLAEELVAEALAGVADDVQARMALPLGVAVGDPAAVAADVEHVRALLRRALDDVDPAAVASRMASAARSAQRAAPVGPMAQLRARQRLAPADVVRLRDHLAAELVPGDPPVLVSRAGEVALDPATLGPGGVDGVRGLLDGEALTAGELGPELAGRLIAAAVLVVDAP